MPLFSFEGRAPNVHSDAWVAPTATLIGDVELARRHARGATEPP